MRLQRVSVAKNTPERGESAAQQPGEGLAELGVEGRVDQRVDGGGRVPQPQRHVACNNQQLAVRLQLSLENGGKRNKSKQAGESTP